MGLTNEFHVYFMCARVPGETFIYIYIHITYLFKYKHKGLPVRRGRSPNSCPNSILVFTPVFVLWHTVAAAAKGVVASGRGRRDEEGRKKEGRTKIKVG